MKFKQLLILINLSLMIYNGNSFEVDNYEQVDITKITQSSRYEEIQKYMVKLTIADVSNNEITINGFVDYIDDKYYIVFLKSLYTLKNNIKTITYIYNNNRVTLSGINFTPLEKVNNPLFYAVELKSIDIHNYYKWLLDKFLNRAFFRNLFEKIMAINPYKNYNKIEIESKLKDSKLGKLSDYYDENDREPSFEFNSISISNDNWYIVGDVNSYISYNLRIVPIRYIDKEIYLNRIYEITGTKSRITFLSLTGNKFNDYDVGSYLIYITKFGGFKIFGQIIKVRINEDRNQIVFIQVFNNDINISSLFNYSVTNLEPVVQELVMDNKDLSTKVDTNIASQQLSKDDDLFRDTKRPRLSLPIEIENFTCGVINTIGTYNLKSRNIIINVTETTPTDFISSTSKLYNIKGYYMYNSLIKHFQECHSSNDGDVNDEYLVTYEKDLEIRIYPNRVVENKH